MNRVPLQAVPSQIVLVNLNNQSVQIAVYQKPEGIFVDVNSNGVDIVIAVQALNGVPLICRQYLGFIGNLIFADTQGMTDPTYEGMSERYALIYLSPEDYDQL